MAVLLLAPNFSRLMTKSCMAQLPIKTQEALGGEKKNTCKVLQTEKKFCPSWRLLFRQHASITDMLYPRKTRKSLFVFYCAMNKITVKK